MSHRRVRALTLALVAWPTCLVAQRPTPPDTILLPGARARQAPAEPTGGPILQPVTVRARDAARAVLASPQVAIALDDMAGLAAFGKTCATTSPRLDAPNDFRESPVALDASDWLVVVATGAPMAIRACEEEWNEGAASVWKGLSLTDSVQGSPPRGASPRALTLMVDGMPLAPLAAASRPSVERSATRWQAGDRQLRYYYDFRAFAPRPDGVAHVIQLVFWQEGGALSEVVPETSARALGDQYVGWRLLKRARDSITAPIAHAPRLPIGGIVGDALGDAASGRTREAGIHLAQWLASSPVTRENLPEARPAKLLLADILLQRGDTLLGRAYLADARRGLPCLAEAAGSSVMLHRMVIATRDADECDERRVTRAVGRGLLLPGLGHAANGSRGSGLLVGSVVAAMLVNAMSLQAQGNARYAEYQSSTDFAAAPRLYQEASEFRSQARARVRTGLLLWFADAGVSAFEALFKNREVRNAQQ